MKGAGRQSPVHKSSEKKKKGKKSTLNKCLLNIFYVPGTFQGTGYTIVIKMDEFPAVTTLMF